MSRSYKSVPHWSNKDESGGHKRYANRRVRRTIDIQSGGAYRKLYEHWNICDCIWIGWTNAIVRSYSRHCSAKSLLKSILK